MESKEEVHSDDGSYELVNFDDYASETEHMNTEGVVSSSKDLSDDSSYDLLCSDVSDTLVLTEDEGFCKIIVIRDKPSDEEDEEQKQEEKSEEDEEQKQVKEGEEDEEEEEEEEEDMGFVSEINLDSYVQPFRVRVSKSKKRDLTAMLYARSSPDPSEPPAQIKSRHDIKEVAKNHITRYLPAKTLFKCRKVSKDWNKWLSCPFFAHEQSQFFRKTSGFFQYSSYKDIEFVSLEKSAYGVPYPSLCFLPEHVSIKSSCNGLLLCQVSNNQDEFYVCNPANAEWILLPFSNSYHGVDPILVLVFEPSSLNFNPRYQVVCLFSLPYTEEAQKVVYFDIYDSETKVWRLSDMICLDLDASEVKSESVYVNGVAYWETKDNGILAFDLKNEIYSVQNLPFDNNGALTNFHGEICYASVRCDFELNACVLDVYGDGFMCLKKTIIVHVHDGGEDGEFLNCEVLGNSCDDVVGLVVRGSWGVNRLYVYHVKDDKVQGLGVLDAYEKLFPYVNSLVSIGGGSG